MFPKMYVLSNIFLSVFGCGLLLKREDRDEKGRNWMHL